MKYLLKEIGNNFEQLLESLLSLIKSFYSIIWYFFLFLTQIIWYFPVYLFLKTIEPIMTKKEEYAREAQMDRLYNNVQRKK